MKVTIITGVSKGLGKALAEKFLREKMTVIGISRTDNEDLKHLVTKGQSYTFISADLTKPEDLQSSLSRVKTELNRMSIDTLYLINNAAIVAPIDRAENVTAVDLQLHYHINVVAPIILLNEIMTVANSKQFKFIGVNISSGAAERPISGWSAYCSSKASINMYTKTVALEQAEKNTKNKIIAFSPGIMDTDMQAQIRDVTSEQFSDVATFKFYKAQNQLVNPGIVANALVDFLYEPTQIQNGHVYHFTDL